jgi:plasmid maintenance system antidote protein VapI
MNYELLRAYIQDSGVKVSVLADKMGISRQSLHLKISGVRLFTQSEIMSLKKTLHMDDEIFMQIFFAECVPETATKEVKT